VSLHEEETDLLAQIASRREWVLEAEHLFDGSWASQAEEITNVEVGRRFDASLERLSCFVEAQERTEEETLRVGHLFNVFTHLRPGLVQCYDIEGFPRTNNEMARTSRACHQNALSSYQWSQKLEPVSLARRTVCRKLKNGGSISLMARHNCTLVYGR
jgi:hypothetical protein